jgi:deoxyhypusine synthase
MQTFKKNIKIDADTDQQADEIVVAMIEMMKIIRKETSTQDFLNLAKALQKRPSLVRTAQIMAGNGN